MTEPDVRRHPATTPRTALVTGAGRGIGRGLAVGLARHGFRLVLVGRTPEHLERTAGEARDAGGDVAAVVPVDVTDAAGVRSAVAHAQDALADDGGIGLLVNNAGVIERREVPFADDDPEDLWRVVETNVRGPVLVTHAVLPAMLARGGGRVVNINSGAAFRPSPAYTGYGLSKGALARLTTLLDAQYRDAGLRVFDLAPGVVATDMTASMPT
jgi:3-oxoacyl-[acyl-carrier protein] reductase